MKTRWAIGSLVVVAMTAAVGVPTASATTLCEAQKETLCPAGERYNVPQKIQGSAPAGVPLELIFGEVTVKCDESKFAAETKLNEGVGKRLKVEIGVWSAQHKGGECETQAGGKCSTTKWTGLPYAEAGFYATINGLGTLKVEKGATIEVVCGMVKCIYSPKASLELAFIGGLAGEAVLRASGLTLEKQAGSNIFCAMTAKLEAEYAISEPAKALWVSKEP
ncbi:MAG TPA: hypothetical protein VFR04_02205 [Solirubrobacterales bacterium]|nr:hypothetical protein [Solirubrobacterales bacterium]